MEQLSPLDAAFLDVEDADPHAALAIGSVAVFAGPTPDPAAARAAILAAMRTVPHTTQKVRRTPLDLTAPVWVDDPDFDPDNHLRRTALPAPGDDAELCELVGRVMSSRMDRDHPLWESWVIEGLAGNRWALLTKVHHSVADGVSGSHLYETALGDRPPTVPASSHCGPLRLLLRAVDPRKPIGVLCGAARSPVRAGRRVIAAARGLVSLAAVALPADPSPLTGPLGSRRGYGVARASLPQVAEIGRHFGATVNDVVLTAVSAALRELLLSRGQAPSARAVRTLVPVSTRAAGEDTLDNRISLLLPLLPVDIADPVEALHAVRARLGSAKRSDQTHAGTAVTDLAAYGPFAPISAAIRIAARLPQRNIITVTTNVPGPRNPLSFLGSELVELMPYVPLALRLRTGVAVLSYRDRLVFGVTTDAHSVPEVDLLTRTIERTIAELAASTRPLGIPFSAKESG
ncbi:wax ester/triacylglycerol synthase family O-acyltransferase [Actinokineospora xionganensis]|uniref:Diacylglycerol O-acyltransferase n=1 Tax=Actinokineospora xionganensis TaxID=2684470 RepID=A0ABR7KZK2_9PSEU|nr:wax ester/triacylglycerol synthase family O-acyltransferase [Actinokineospora xionganensis]MBC6445863.1 wax ester/triacylglycerol synthase family O-acyltransferase [Actinokineospora xionganensis]